MSRPLRFGSAVSAIVLAAMLASCAASQQKTGFGGRADENVGLATRAMLALNAHDLPTAVDFAERAVEKNPNDAGFRALLGNAYFAAGRFWSAETAYKDSLTIYSNQPQVILKLALAETALGKKDEAVAFLEAGRSVLNPSDYGLALALAGRPSDAITVLDAAARQQGADATVRQNLALAHALAGDWTEARTIAEQDVPANKLDARMAEWMQLASPKNASVQVAALVGVTPAAADHGEPVRLALSKTDTMFAEAAPAAKTIPAPQVNAAPAPHAEVAMNAPAPQQQVANTSSRPAAQPKFVAAVATPASRPEAVPAVAPAVKPVAKPVIAQESVATPVAMLAAAAEEVSSAAAHKLESAVEAFMPTKNIAAPHPVSRRLVAARAPHANGAVMQLGAYRSPEYLSTAWNELVQRHPALRAYLPLKARFVSSKGTFWRLSIEGFSNEREAMVRCQQLKNNGGSCFVRSAAGDAPVEFASR